MEQKIWTNSADSHVLEPHDLWLRTLPSELAPRAPRTERDDGRETVYVDEQVVRRDPIAFAEAMRPPGAEDVQIRLKDLDEQGVWGEVTFPSRAISIRAGVAVSGKLRYSSSSWAATSRAGLVPCSTTSSSASP